MNYLLKYVLHALALLSFVNFSSNLMHIFHQHSSVNVNVSGKETVGTVSNSFFNILTQ